MLAAQIILLAACVYTGAGLLFAAVFVTRGVGEIDLSALRAPLGFRIMIFPASALLWPVLSAKWIRAARTNERERRS